MALGLAAILFLVPGIHQVAMVSGSTQPSQNLAPMQASSSEKLAPPAFNRVTLLQPVKADIRVGSNSGDEKTPASKLNASNVGGPENLAGIFVPEPAKPLGPFKAGPDVVRHERSPWLALTIAQHAAATFDAWSTRRSINNKGVYESDPLMRPFAHSSVMYGAIQLAPTALDLLGRRMMRSQNKWVHRLWWVPQSAATFGFVYSGARNMKYGR